MNIYVNRIIMIRAILGSFSNFLDQQSFCAYLQTVAVSRGSEPCSKFVDSQNLSKFVRGSRCKCLATLFDVLKHLAYLGWVFENVELPSTR